MNMKDILFHRLPEKPPYYYALSIRKTMMNSLDRLLPKEEAWNYEGCFAW